jgi:hypothetical protein
MSIVNMRLSEVSAKSRTKKDIIKDLIITGTVVAVFFWIVPLVAPKLGLEDISPLLEAVVTGTLVFVTLQLRIAQRFARIANRSANIAEGAVSEMRKSIEAMSETKTDLQKSIVKFDLLSGQREEIIDLGRKVFRTVISAKGGIPNIDEVTKPLKFKEAAEVTERVARSFQEYADAWSKQADKVLMNADKSIIYAWCRLIESYHQRQVTSLGKGEIFISPEAYTDIVFSCCKQLVELSGAGKITLFLVTAMLPDEFYNWPQEEYTKDSLYPEYIAHTWEGAERYFKEMRRLKGMKDMVTVRRCILVKANGLDDGIGLSAAPSIRKYEDLRRTGELMIHEMPLRYEDIGYARLEHMFSQMTKLKNNSHKDGKKFLGIDNFEFYPIGTKNEFKRSRIEPRRALLKAFIEDLHTSPDDALFHIMDSADSPVYRILSGHQELMPELAMFKIDGKITESQPAKWLFGIVGYLYPFTETMTIRFVAGSELDELEEPLRDFERGSRLADIS